MPPVLAGLTPVSGVVGTAVTLTGTYFGATQGSSTLKFNGVTATPTNWSANSITAPVPSGATSGPIVATVGGLNSNSLAFIVTSTGSVSGTVTRASNATPINGASVQILQSGAVKASATTNPSGQYSTGTLPAGFSDASVTASGFAPEVVTSFSVGGGGVSTVNVALKVPGSITGLITQQGGGPLSGASVVASLAGVPLGSTTSNAAGSYTLSLKPGTYVVEASSPGYSPANQTGAVVSESATTTVNLSLSSVAPTTISYTYDEVGRLVGVTDATGDTARYAYDAVGNLLTITRQATTQVSILEFSPNSGPVGTPVTIRGTGFSATPAQNTVSFNGTVAVVSTATPTQLSVTVPASATTGPVAVTSPGGSATGPSNFIVAPIPGPSITNVSPLLGPVGTPITITGTNFQTTPANNAVSVNATTALVSSSTATSISSSIPVGARSGRVRLATPLGVSTSAATFYVVPSGYVAADVASTMVLAYDIPIFISTPAGKISIAVFEGVANQRVRVSIAPPSLACLIVKLYDTADDPWLLYMGTYGGGSFNPTESQFITSNGTRIFDARVLPYAGGYQLVVINQCAPDTTGTTATVSSLPPDIVGSIVASGSSVTSSITSIGQNALLTFNASAGQRVSFLLSGSGLTGCGAGAGFFPAAPFVTFTTFGKFGGLGCLGFMDPVVIPVTGSNKIFLDPVGAEVGTLTSTLYNVPPDPTGPITPGGSPITITTTVPGQNGVFSFAGTTGQRVSLVASASSYSGTLGLSFKRADGTVLKDSLFNNFLDTTTLPAAETYTLLVDPWQMQVGSATLTLYDVPPDMTGATTVNGAAVNFTTAIPGHNASITFPGTASQSVTVRGSNNTIGCTQVRLLKPDGVQLALTNQCGTTITLGPVTLPTSGTYTIQVDPLEV